MSARTASSTDAIVYVRLLNEGVDVWRPVEARRLGPATFQLAPAPVPDHEEWAFQPGDTVVAEPGVLSSGRAGNLIAVARASDFDSRSQAHRLAS